MKALTTPLRSTPPTALTATHTRCCSRKRRSSKDSTSAGNPTSAGGVQWRRGYESLSPVDAHQSRYPLPLPRLRSNCPLLPKRGFYSGGGGERVGGIKSRWREDVRLGQRARPRKHDEGVPPGATRNTLGACGRTRSRGRGGAEGNPTTPSISPGRANFRGINGSSSISSSDDSHTSSCSSNSIVSEDLPALVGRPAWDLEVFGELPALQGGRTRSQSRGLTVSASYANALLAYGMRAVEAEKIIEGRSRKSNELTIHCWKSAWRRDMSYSRSSRGAVRY